jgi:hypothetical protein
MRKIFDSPLANHFSPVMQSSLFVPLHLSSYFRKKKWARAHSSKEPIDDFGVP